MSNQDQTDEFGESSSSERKPLLQPMRVNPPQIATGKRLWQVPDAVNESGCDSPIQDSCGIAEGRESNSIAVVDGNEQSQVLAATSSGGDTSEAGTKWATAQSRSTSGYQGPSAGNSFNAFMQQWKEGIEAMHNKATSKPIATCWACDQVSAYDCCCGNPICERHSFDTFGQHAKFGICSDCVEQVNYHYGDHSGDSVTARERFGLIQGGK